MGKVMYLVLFAFICIVNNVCSTSIRSRKNIDDILNNQLGASYDKQPFVHVANANIKAERISNETKPANFSKAGELLRSKLHLFDSATRFEKALNDTNLAPHSTWKDEPLQSVKTIIGNPNTKYATKSKLQDTPIYEVHAIRCCLDNGKKLPMKKYGCNKGTYDQAKEVCKQAGARLCSVEEIRSCRTCGTGCGFDKRRIWTSTGDDREIKYTYGVGPIKKFIRGLRHNVENKYMDEIVNSHISVKADPTQEQVDQFHEDFINKERKATIFPKRIGHMKGEKDQLQFLKGKFTDEDDTLELGKHGNN
eukprot:g4956.t1